MDFSIKRHKKLYIKKCYSFLVGKVAKEKTSVARLVKGIILSRPAVRECLIMDIINYSGLARLLVEDLQKKGVKTSVGAVKMALIRIGEELKKEKSSFEEKIKGVAAKTVIELQSDLTVITAEKRSFLSKVNPLSKIMETARFFQLTQGVETFTLVISSEEKDRVIRTLGKENIVDLIEQQTAIILISPEEIIETPGFVAFVTSALSSNGINITQVISCHKDTIFVVDRRVAPKAYQVLEELILRMREA